MDEALTTQPDSLSNKEIDIENVSVFVGERCKEVIHSDEVTLSLEKTSYEKLLDVVLTFAIGVEGSCLLQKKQRLSVYLAKKNHRNIHRKEFSYLKQSVQYTQLFLDVVQLHYM